jgi:hypothetical protein
MTTLLKAGLALTVALPSVLFLVAANILIALILIPVVFIVLGLIWLMKFIVMSGDGDENHYEDWM